MAKSKKTPNSVIENIVNENTDTTITIQWNGVDIGIKNSISFEEAIEFVNSVVKCCFREDNNEYIPEAKDIAIGILILEKYTDLSVPEKTDTRYKLVCCTDIIDAVCEHINQRQLKTIIEAINEKLYYATQTNIGLFEKQIDVLIESFNDISNQMSRAFENISGDDMRNLIGAISNNAIDEDKLVKAYLKNMNVMSSSENTEG